MGTVYVLPARYFAGSDKEELPRQARYECQVLEGTGGCLDEDTIIRLKEAGVKIEVGGTTNYKTTKKPVRMEYQEDYTGKNFKDIPTYKRMCVCIIKNDHLCKYMGFSLTKSELDRREAIKEKYKDL